MEGTFGILVDTILGAATEVVVAVGTVEVRIRPVAAVRFRLIMQLTADHFVVRSFGRFWCGIHYNARIRNSVYRRSNLDVRIRMCNIYNTRTFSPEFGRTLEFGWTFEFGPYNYYGKFFLSNLLVGSIEGLFLSSSSILANHFGYNIRHYRPYLLQ